MGLMPKSRWDHNFTPVLIGGGQADKKAKQLGPILIVKSFWNQRLRAAEV